MENKEIEEEKKSSENESKKEEIKNSVLGINLIDFIE